MKLTADYHVHSKNCRFFHAKNSIEEMAYAANAIGLKEIAITDHGFRHICGTNKQKLKKAREIIDDINTWSTTKVLLGIEADIIAEDGTIDVDNETLTMIDMLVVGYHRMIKTDFAGFFGNVEKTKEAKEKCTRAFINAINRYPVNIISHLDSVLTTDLYEIGKLCRERGTLIEINNRHTNWNQDQVDELLASGCLFVVSSDAHNRESVGVVDKAFEIIKKYDIPSECVVNVEFDYAEKSENDKEMEVAFSYYRKQMEKKAEEDAKKEETKKYEYTESLSPEMEKALAEIAKEQGLNYVNKNEAKETEFEGLNFEFMTPEEVEIIKQAQELLAKYEQNEQSQTEQIQVEDDFNITEEDNEDLVENLNVLNNTAVYGEEFAKEVVEESKEQPELVVEPIQEKPTPAEEKTQENKKTATADEILKALADIKASQTNVKDEQAPKQKVSLKIEKNAPTTKKVASVGGKPKIVDVDVENMVKKPEKPAETKPAKTRKSYGGFIGGAGGVVGLAEDNQKKITKPKEEK